MPEGVWAADDSLRRAVGATIGEISKCFCKSEIQCSVPWRFEQTPVLFFLMAFRMSWIPLKDYISQFPFADRGG